jgi:hypothetical protein
MVTVTKAEKNYVGYIATVTEAVKNVSVTS